VARSHRHRSRWRGCDHALLVDSLFRASRFLNALWSHLDVLRRCGSFRSGDTGARLRFQRFVRVVADNSGCGTVVRSGVESSTPKVPRSLNLGDRTIALVAPCRQFRFWLMPFARRQQVERHGHVAAFVVVGLAALATCLKPSFIKKWPVQFL
jgi:hypothetical protein